MRGQGSAGGRTPTSGHQHSASTLNRARTTAGVAVVVLLLAACGAGSTSGAGATTSIPSATGPAASSTAAPATQGTSTDEPASPSPTATADVEATGTPGSGVDDTTAVLREMRAATHDGYDRVVLEFDRPVNAYLVRYVDAITEDPSDAPVPMQGTAFIQVVVQGATLDNSFQLSGSQVARTYAGPHRLTPLLPQVREIATAGDFEATLSFGIGLASKAGFTVTRLTSPSRIVVDVAKSS